MNAQQQNLHPGANPQAEVKVFGIPMGDLGFFTSVLMAFAVGFLSFFLFTFLAIVGIMICNGLGHRFNYADSYKYISFPAGCVVLAISLIFLGTLWLRRKFSRG